MDWNMALAIVGGITVIVPVLFGIALLAQR
jgi:hypothetical protein